MALGAGESVLQRRAEATALGAEVERLTAAAASARAVAASRIGRRRRRADGAWTRPGRPSPAPRRIAGPPTRRSGSAARDAEAAVREAAWAEAQADRLRNDHARAAAALAAMDGTADPGGSATDGTRGLDRGGHQRHRGLGDPRRRDASATRPPRRAGRDRRCRPSRRGGATDPRRDRDRPRRGADGARRPRARGPRRPRAATSPRNAIACARSWPGPWSPRRPRDRPSPSCMPRTPRTGSDSTTAEHGASAARERLRAADDRLRTADRAELEARLGLDALRESVLVDLAGLGEPGLAHLAAVSGMALARSPAPVEDADRTPSPRSTAEVDVDAGGDTAAFESALDAAADRWAAAPPTETPPGPARLRPAPPAVPRARRGQPVRRRRVRRARRRGSRRWRRRRPTCGPRSCARAS